ncbi:MAG TPA: hypothetical protein VFK80_08230 [Limnochordia bacterium]|nr:hypothetical protein [Limnochordia bacterium]
MGELLMGKGVATGVLDPCPHCGSQWRAVDFDKNTARWGCGSKRQGMLVERSFACHEIEALKREAEEGQQ